MEFLYKSYLKIGVLGYTAPTSFLVLVPVSSNSPLTPYQFSTFGELLKFLRRRRGFTQLELSLAVGYSESQISHLEQNHRAPDTAAIAARFVPALQLDREPVWVDRLLELAELSHTAGESGEKDISHARQDNLPTELTSFIGRQQELAEIARILTTDAKGGVRLLTLSGAGGGGKTRLALRAAAGLVPFFPDGVWWVDLSSLAEPTLVPQAIAAVFGLKGHSARSFGDILADFLRARHMLLVLDNCEHLIAATAELTEVLLRECPALKILVTSREVLNIGGENSFRVPPLSTPDSHVLTNLDALKSYDAVQLFLERAVTVAPNFLLTAENAPAVIQVCLRLDGIPLAIELAAARLRMLSVVQLAARLDDRFRLLTGGIRTAPARHQTLAALIDWSHELLPEPERLLFRRLSVFAGGWTLEAAETVANAGAPAAGGDFELLGRLIDKSLVMVESHGESVRYRMLETVREYALTKLKESGEEETIRSRHALYFLALAETDNQSDPWFFPNQALHDRMQAEHDNLRAALKWSQTPNGDAEIGLRLAAAMLRFWFERGFWSEWRGWLDNLLANAGTARASHGMARVLFGLGSVLALQGDFAAAEMYLQQSEALYQVLGDSSWSVYVSFRLGWVARERGDAVTARQRMESSLEIFRAQGDLSRVAEALITLGEVAVMQEDSVWANELLQEGLALARAQVGTDEAIPWALNHSGHVAQLRGDYALAAELHEQSLEIFQQLDKQHPGVAWAHEGLGETALAQNRAAVAALELQMALLLFRDLGDRMGLTWCLAGLAGVAALENQPERAVKMWSAAETLRLSIGARQAPATTATHYRLLAHANRELDDERAGTLHLLGKQVSMQEAIDDALALVSEIHVPRSTTERA